MGRPVQDGRGTSAVARLLGLLAVVVGLLAMHGLSSAHHAAAAVPVPPAAGHALGAAASDSHDHPRAAPGAHEHPGAAAHGAAGEARATSAAQLALSAPAGPACHEQCRPGTALLCLAVLAAASAAALLAAAARRRAADCLRVRLCPARPPVPGRPLPVTPDPVEDLCVSRT